MELVFAEAVFRAYNEATGVPLESQVFVILGDDKGRGVTHGGEAIVRLRRASGEGMRKVVEVR